MKRSMDVDTPSDRSMGGVVYDGRWKDEVKIDSRIMSSWRLTGRPLRSTVQVEACARDVGCSSVFLED